MTVLIAILLVTGMLHQIEPGPSYDASFYRSYEAKFDSLSRMAAAEESLLVGQHYPDRQADNGTTGNRQALAVEPSGDSEAEVAASDTSDAEDGSAEVININEAGPEELETLPGIGPAIAERIIDYRRENGPFQAKSELKEVRGIGEARFENISSLITVNESENN